MPIPNRRQPSMLSTLTWHLMGKATLGMLS